MKKKTSINYIIAFVIIFLIPASYLIISSGKNRFKHLEIFGPREVSSSGDTVYHSLAPFSFTDQLGNTVTEKDIAGKIVVADFFFTTCRTICPKMTMQLVRVQYAYRNDPELMILSHTVDPENDSVPVLAVYAKKHSADYRKWKFLTGDKKSLYDMARHSYMVTAMEGDGGTHDFIHSEFLVLIDKEKRIRGFYDGTIPMDVQRLIDEIKVLKLEYMK